LNGAAQNPGSRPEKRVRLSKALRRFGPYVWRYRLRALSVLLLGLASGLLAKAPFLLLYPFTKKVVGLQLGSNDGAADAKPTAILRGVLDFTESVRASLESWFPALGGGAGATSEDKISLLVTIGVCVVVVAALGGFVQFMFVKASRNLSLKILADLRQDLAAHVLRLGMQYHTSSRKGDLLSRATTDVNIILVALSLAFDDLVLEPAQVLGNLVLTLGSNPFLTLLVFVMIPIVIIPLVIFGKRVRKGTRKSLTALGESTEAMSQMFSGIRVVKAFRMEERELEDFREANQNWITRSMSVVRAKAMTEGITHFLTYAGFVILLCGFGFVQIQSGALSDLGSLTIWVVGFSTMYQHVKRISKAYQTVQESMGASERLFEVLDLPPAAVSGSRGSRKLRGPIEGLEFRNVGFAYDGEPVLSGLSFHAKAGETIAIVGASGAGKSTLIDLVARFYDPESGGILVNDIDIRELDPDVWFANWALVDQHPFLFHASIRENVAYGKPNASDEEIRSALRAANLLDFIETLPAGMQTEVGDRGARLSGGQRQRLTIARAILKNPAILLLDEVTSALDAESEQAVREALERLMAGRTSIVVAHRLSTIRKATRILVLDRGKVVEEGSHEALLRTAGPYRRLYEMQFGEQVA
jgi:subfamily B ATP-binding cassette protein MsbA